MRIAYLAAGAAGMYCGSCLHDNTLAAALLRLGEDVVLVPIYTPIRTDEVDVSRPQVFYGGINAYLQQKWPIFRRTPRWLDGWLDHPAVLRLLAGRSSSVDPARLGDMTVSMLRGEEGNQRKELDKLVDWLIGEVQPDVVHLSNSMMLGLARRIAERCGPPVVCSLSGEDVFLEKLKEPHYSAARQLLEERARDVQAFTALNGYYADFMSEYLRTPRDRIHVIPHGLDMTGHGDPAPKPADAPRRVGFFSRICPDKGLHLLIEAGEKLMRRSDLPSFEIHAGGYLGPGDRKYFNALVGRANQGPLAGRFHYHGEPDRAGKIALLQSFDLLAIPATYRESKGLPVLEGWANAVPVVVPNHGAYPEMVRDTEAGLLHEPHNAADLAEQVARLLKHPEIALQLGRRGHAFVRSHRTSEAMARQTLALYRDLTAVRPPKSGG